MSADDLPDDWLACLAVAPYLTIECDWQSSLDIWRETLAMGAHFQRNLSGSAAHFVYRWIWQ